jgi:hypothetical protein
VLASYTFSTPPSMWNLMVQVQPTICSEQKRLPCPGLANTRTPCGVRPAPVGVAVGTEHICAGAECGSRSSVIRGSRAAYRASGSP